MLRRRLSLLQAVSLNMAMMVGVGIFTTLPLLLGSMGGPRALLAWVLGAALAAADGLVWCELAAAFPGSGGTYHFFDAVYGDSKAGRLLKFLFVWQFLLGAPLEIASGAIGLGRYAGYLWPALGQAAWRWAPAGAGSWAWTVTNGQVAAVGVMAAAVALAYRRIEAAGRLMVALWVGMLATVAWVIVDGLPRLGAADLALAPGGWSADGAFATSLGVALGLAMYNYFGYYQVCYLGDEVADPSRTMPRSILISVGAVAGIFVAASLAMLAVVPWRDAIQHPDHLASDMMLALHGAGAARAITAMILWTGGAALFAALVGYSRVPYAAARSGHFFRGLAATHPRGDFPHRSLILLGVLSALACLADLDAIIAALLASRIAVQFLGQIATVVYLRARPDLLARMPFRMPLFPLPAALALAGWLWIFGTSPRPILAFGLGTLVLGALAFLAWERASRRVASP